MQEREETAQRYLRFADQEARGRSTLYETLCCQIAKDREIISFLLTLPKEKRQPNLLLAAVRHLAGLQTRFVDFRAAVLSQADTLRAFMLGHSTQTNEGGRCAVLLPVLARLPQPLALLEVGASAGLCLLPDAYRYDYGGRIVGNGDGPVFPCEASSGAPLPGSVPQIAWRAGIDLEPVDASDPAQQSWLESLVWPEQTGRLERLRAALEIVRERRPRIVEGDLLGEELDRLCDEAPKDATLVVFHTAVIAYVPDRAQRQAFAEKMQRLCDYWVANEAKPVFPDIAEKAGEGPTGRFLLSVNGTPLAWTDPHGATVDWFGPDPAGVTPYGRSR